MGKANQAINVSQYDLLVSLRYIKGVAFYKNTIFVVAIFILVLIAVLYWFFGTELGCAIRATGCNASMSPAQQGINTNFNKVLGLMVSKRTGSSLKCAARTVSGLCRCQYGAWRDRHRTGRCHHR